MRGIPIELELPLGDSEAGDLARSRLEHLAHVAGMDGQGVLRLSRAFPTLGSVYAASEIELAAVVGTVAAARIRWFLDAPLSTGLALSGLPRFSKAA
ncbi:MAG: hypothetical protein ABR564_02045 [Candidatus Dormibacteria bacterium]